MDKQAINELRNFAMKHATVHKGFVPHTPEVIAKLINFGHVCAAAIEGEKWAAERISLVLANVADDTMWCAANRGHVGDTLIACKLEYILATDTTRPDGGIAKSFTP